MSKEDDLLIEVAGTALSLAAMNTLLLWRKGLIPADELKEFAEKLQSVAKAYEAAGADKTAAQYHTLGARLLGAPPSLP